MKNLTYSILITLFFFLILSSVSFVFAQSQGRGNNTTAVENNQINNMEENEEMEEGTESPEPERNTGSGVGLENALKNMERLQERINNPEAGEQVQETVRAQTEANIQIQERLQNMEARPGFLRFILGPDYKNAGEVRSSIVRLQNQERQMLKIKEGLTDPEDIDTIDEAIETVQSSIVNYQQTLSEKLQGFSLFGWLSRFLSGYQSATSPTPSESPTIEPTVTP